MKHIVTPVACSWRGSGIRVFRLSRFCPVSRLVVSLATALMPSAVCHGQSVPLPTPMPGAVPALKRVTVPSQTPSAPAPAVITSFVVIGNRTLSATAIALAAGHKEGDAFTPQILEEMRERLLRTGWFGLHTPELTDAVKVSAEADPQHAGQYKIVIEVDENDTLTGVAILGSGPIQPEEILPLLHLKKGMIYIPIQFRRDFSDIRALYDRRGYLVTASPDAGLDAQNVLNVALQVVRVSEIRVAGNRHTRPIAILRAMQTRRGSFLNRETLQQDRARLLNLGLFDTVEVAARDQGAGQVALDVQVKERQGRAVTGGFNYGANGGVSGTAQISDDNFRGLGESLGLYGELSSDLRRHSVALDYRNPWLDPHRTGLDLQLYDKSLTRFADSLSGSSSAYLQQRTGGSAALSRPLARTLRMELNFRGEQTVTDPAGVALTNASIVQDGPLYSVGGTLKRDTRDLLGDPTRGGYQSFSLNLGHADLHSPLSAISPYGSHNYLRSALDYRIYLSPFGSRRVDHPDEEKTSLALRVLAGGAAGKLPFGEQFFLGGADSLRGYREDRFWGSRLLLGSMELRQPIAPRFKLVAFMDVGQAWGGDYGSLNLNGFNQNGDSHPHVGAGFGVRAVTGLGAVRLDLGFGNEGTRAHFGFGHTF